MEGAEASVANGLQVPQRTPPRNTVGTNPTDALEWASGFPFLGLCSQPAVMGACGALGTGGNGLGARHSGEILFQELGVNHNPKC